jgi:polysaccharide pyruvyl transferase WcaK-like protein
MISINIPRDDMKELIVVIAVNTAMIEGILRDYHGKMDKIDVIGLEGAAQLGRTMVAVLSMSAGITQSELVNELRKFKDSAKTEVAKNTRVYFNQSKDENLDTFVKDMFGEEGT